MGADDRDNEDGSDESLADLRRCRDRDAGAATRRVDSAPLNSFTLW